MVTFKKLLAGSLLAALLAPAFAFAQTSTTSATAIVGQIQTLQGQINALQAQQQTAIATLVSMLKQGSTGDQVTILQALLAADTSIYPEGLVTGYFGKLTAQAVKRFQKQNGIDQVGFVGPKTLKKLQELLNKHPLAFATASSTSSTATTTPWANNKGKSAEKRLCAAVPPGHLVAPGWLRKHEGEDKPVVPTCQTLPKGIKDLLENGRGDSEDEDNNSTTTPPVTDVTAPTISNIAVSNLATSTATVAWTTNENATGKVYYATSSPVDLSTAPTMSDTSLVTSHSFGLTGLATSTTYYYVLESKDAAANTATTSAQSLVTTTD